MKCKLGLGGVLAIMAIIFLIISVANADKCEDCLQDCINRFVRQLCLIKCRDVCPPPELLKSRSLPLPEPEPDTPPPELQRHFQADTLPWIQRMQQKEQVLQRRLLRAMRIIEALEGKGCRVPLMKGEVELAEKLAATTRQLKGSGAELSRRVQNLLMVSRLQADSLIGSSMYLPGSTKIHEQSLSDMQEVLQRQTEAIARLGNVLKRDVRDMEIIMAEDTDTEMTQQD